VQLTDDLEQSEWIARPRLTPLRRLGIYTVEDLLTHYPRRHEDRRQFVGFPRQESDVPICICGEVTKTSVRRFGGWKKIFEATIEKRNRTR
jgi:ATP-dependent DNA helicase RecG